MFNTFIMNKLIFYFGLILLVGIVSCNNEYQNTSTEMEDLTFFPPQPLSILSSISDCNSSISLNISENNAITNYEYSELFMNYLNLSIQQFPMEVFCACDCTMTAALIPWLYSDDTRNSFLPYFSLIPPVSSLSCEDAFETIATKCMYGVDEQSVRLNSLLIEIKSNSQFESINSIGIDEILLPLINDIVDGDVRNINFCNYYNAYNALGNQMSEMSKIFIGQTLIIAETTSLYYVNVGDEVLGEDEGGFPDEAMINKALGAVFGAWWGSMTYIATGGDLEGPGGLVEAAAWGAAGGAISGV